MPDPAVALLEQVGHRHPPAQIIIDVDNGEMLARLHRQKDQRNLDVGKGRVNHPASIVTHFMHSPDNPIDVTREKGLKDRRDIFRVVAGEFLEEDRIARLFGCRGDPTQGAGGANMLESGNRDPQGMTALADQAACERAGLVAELLYDILYPFPGFWRDIGPFIDHAGNRLCRYPRHRSDFLDRCTHVFCTHNGL